MEEKGKQFSEKTQFQKLPFTVLEKHIKKNIEDEITDHAESKNVTNIYKQDDHTKGSKESISFNKITYQEHSKKFSIQ